MAQESAISTRGSKPTRQDQVNQVNLSVESSCLPGWEIIFLVREPHVTPSCMKGEVVGTEASREMTLRDGMTNSTVIGEAQK